MVSLAGACFWFWNSFHSFLTSSGVSRRLIERYPQGAFNKYQKMRNILDDLEQAGDIETVNNLVSNFFQLRWTDSGGKIKGDLVSLLAGLGRGEALVLGEAVPLPTRVQFDKPSPTPNSDDVDFYAKWKDGPEDLDVDEIVKRWRRQER